ncbi:nucleoside diphosphate kinase regulator [Jiella pacifica]|uniref:Nucleoside diphosphate kinase regulator n=1 Tax=Jiella pacifica TaxID=2696469 RepID=A0A6N9T913_9HYPH|nr:nucleoside diphosphate kinase regulator [Jiella pacifica]NDW07934.1 nucleoside diphosphate kinase regulator [Jiella pacifica]
MRHHQSGSRLPKLAVTEQDYESLSRLANAALDRIPEVAEELLQELERARIVSERAAKPNVVRMGSNLTYRSDDGAERNVTIVYPAHADISLGRVSILTPIGAALIGLSEGQSIAWTTRSGRKQMLTVLAVTAPSEATV